MVLKINQSLHGYQNGHQLLASSIELGTLDRNSLLFQSDLTGSMVDTGFDSYITGYPLVNSSIYVFAKTWYAPEMERPGCVWTHSLLIDFADIGKIPEFEILNKLFLRPFKNSYQTYNDQISFDLTKAIKTIALDKKDLSEQRIKIINGLYRYPNQTLLITSNSSLEYEEEIIRSWSDQWPRLRRNFTFCSGALNLKTIGDKEYDLQVVPQRTINSIQRKSVASITLTEVVDDHEEWIEILRDRPKQELRKFLWAYGADIDGERENYIALVELFDLVTQQEVNLDLIIQALNKYFPSVNKGKFLKKNLFGEKTILNIDEEDIVSFILSVDELPSIEIEDLQLTERVAKLANDGMSYDRLAKLIKRDKTKRLDVLIWDKVGASTDLILKLIADDSDLVDHFVIRSNDFAAAADTWRISFHLQKLILRSIIKNSEDINWKSIFDAMLNAKSKIILDAYNLLGSRVINYTLSWLNESKSKRTFVDDWASQVLTEERILHNWIREQGGKLNFSFYSLLFERYTAKGLERVLSDVKLLIAGYEEVINEVSVRERNIYAITLLSIGLNNNLKNSYLLIERTMPLIYSEVTASRIREEVWRNINRESPWYDSEDFDLLDYIPFVKNVRKKRFEVDYWDIGRQLIVTVVNNYVRNSWPFQSFVNCFPGKTEFKDSLQYSFTFEKGVRHLKKMLYEIKQGRLKLNSIQAAHISKFLK